MDRVASEVSAINRFVEPSEYPCDHHESSPSESCAWCWADLPSRPAVPPVMPKVASWPVAGSRQLRSVHFFRLVILGAPLDLGKVQSDGPAAGLDRGGKLADQRMISTRHGPDRVNRRR